MRLNRIDVYPTHDYQGFKLRIGHPLPMGAQIIANDVVNFAIFSDHASACSLVLFRRGQAEPFAEIPFAEEFRIGHVWAMMVFDIDIEDIEYGYRMYGPFEPHKGHRFDPSKILLDPYAKMIAGQDVWGIKPDTSQLYLHRARIMNDSFDWEDDRQLGIPYQDLIIYEMHIRDLTAHPSAQVQFPGTFASITEKIPYLLELGVNAIELMPIFEFNEFEYDRINPYTNEQIFNYWGYSSVGFFAPKAGYAAMGPLSMQTDELKALVKTLHLNNIEVILDVVYNHTAEGNENGETISFKGIDNRVYYMLTPDGRYYNFSGTGNTLNCNHPVVREMVIDCLRYWVSEYHIDGFRFDLASILGRDQNGVPLLNPPLLEALAHDPILAQTKLIAEAWDAGGLYQVGSFPAYGRFAEWNGKYRDCVRKFLKGDAGQLNELAQRIMGSPDLYNDAEDFRPPAASINFITCHDGFSLYDLFSYNNKHNIANGENNQDGANDNYSWNCGAEGETTDPKINRLRYRMMKNAVAILMVSHGIPMLFNGDEIARTKSGNNNTYCHDNELNWIDWSYLEKNQQIFRFFKQMIEFRKAHPVLRGVTHFQNKDYVGSGYPDISWHGVNAWNPDWSVQSRSIAFMLCGKHASQGREKDNYVYVAMNMYWQDLRFELPALPAGYKWFRFANTAAESPHDISEIGAELEMPSQRYMMVSARSVVILLGG